MTYAQARARYAALYAANTSREEIVTDLRQHLTGGQIWAVTNARPAVFETEAHPAPLFR